ncbi:hypothetical protein GCM10011529_09060 [Polymorphobacter glacialis]|uniref:YdhG-like domain-containing protein n=1 Tax=Sandarakinorhabdus glacialis TaxID=1614636 RepID=A0A917E4Z3_9SPHN|nr:YdeI/OmpD-associated family protein [Polymorphobacter glacialis]GGE04894.1 hypothetical protein GCM10011529_09060 [Polymorphobacter glacialis]
MTEDARVDAYIEAAAPFAQPILRHMREIVHAACPETEETLKWSMPAFLYKDRQICGMAAFKAHAGVHFSRREVAGEAGMKGQGMGQFGKVTSVADMPADDVLAAMVAEAMALVDAGGKAPRLATKKPPAEMPDDLRAALDAVPAAAAAFAGFPPSAQREYIEWVIEAKQAATRARRLATTVEWTAEGKRRYWQMAGR